MITEPEIDPGEPGTGAGEGGAGDGGVGDRTQDARELLSGGERAWREAASGPGAGRRAPWIWALGGFAAAAALAAGALQVTGYGRTPAPDLHGYRLASDLCTSLHLQPLVDAIGAPGMTAVPQPTRRGATIDHTSCQLAGSVSHGDGWSTDYTVEVTVDLHKKHDPRPEFEDAVRDEAASPAPGASLLPVPPPGEATVVTAYPGLGDRAYLAGSRTRQALGVVHGGAVLSLSVQAANTFTVAGSAPLASATTTLPGPTDTTSLRPALPASMRLLMTALTH
ncbi:hypothetical protein [Streptomyces sp. NPDC020917]|uniref:hypothetical protein n=1 Tax=Streptomyces sp. NPDC020917 TaxID=3365102 RepID=UPI0037958296